MTFLEELFDHIASQSMCNWDFHHILLVSSFKEFVVQYACLNCAKILSDALLILDKSFVDIYLNAK